MQTLDLSSWSIENIVND
ncbi:MAG: hypothetical protein IKX40_05890 [Thermoguttaceae bacterium]|nr:hypothetical protein [Thermoguttaceae bacterium]